MARKDTKLVRIKPSNNRESHTAFGVSIRKASGWHEVATHVADDLAEERMNCLNPEASPFVFDVQSHDEARATADAENVVADPAGTVDRPRVVATPAPPPLPVKSKKGARTADEVEGS